MSPNLATSQQNLDILLLFDYGDSGSGVSGVENQEVASLPSLTVYDSLHPAPIVHLNIKLPIYEPRVN
jgi:hypothetical protein